MKGVAVSLAFVVGWLVSEPSAAASRTATLCSKNRLRYSPQQTPSDDLVDIDPSVAAKVDRRSFRDYYGQRASVADSLGSRDEWDIVRAINKRRLSDPTTGIANQIGHFLRRQTGCAGHAGDARRHC